MHRQFSGTALCVRMLIENGAARSMIMLSDFPLPELVHRPRILLSRCMRTDAGAGKPFRDDAGGLRRAPL
jgi:hypothetical protein